VPLLAGHHSSLAEFLTCEIAVSTPNAFEEVFCAALLGECQRNCAGHGKSDLVLCRAREVATYLVWNSKDLTNMKDDETDT